MLTRLLLVVVVAVPSIAQAQAHDFAATTGEVVAWNFAGFGTIPPQRQDRIVRVLEDLDAEVIAAVEVSPDEVLDDVASELTERGACHEPVMPEQSANLNIGVIAKCGADVTNRRLIPGSDAGNSALRKALAVDVRLGAFDFILVTVHMKSGRGSEARAIRDRQARAIASFLTSETSARERDVLIVGDFNMIPDTDGSNFQEMNPSGLLRYVSSEELVGEFSHLSGSGCEEGNLLDGFAISDGHTDEYVEASLRIYPVHRERDMSLCEFREDVSDHLPLLARFRITSDDDGATAVGDLRIVALAPNPEGIDHGSETVELENSGPVAVTLEGWRIADDDGNVVPLSGSIAPGASREVTIDHTAMLNNDGDTVRLLSPTLEELAVTYSVRAESGRTLECGPEGVCR